MREGLGQHLPRKYANPPVLEAVCQFQFKETDPWDWTVPGLIYDRIKGTFPVKRQENAIQISVTQGKPAEAVSSGAITKMQFLREDSSALVQVQPHVLTVNQLKPYPEWPAFKALILEQLHVYTDVAKEQQLTRIGLRYINRIEIPAAKFELEQYFVALPSVPAGIPDTFGSFLMQVEIPHDDPSMTLRLAVGSLPPSAADQSAVMLDLDMVTDQAPNIDGVAAWLDTAHDRLETVFDKSLTEKTHKELLKEEVHA